MTLTPKLLLFATAVLLSGCNEQPALEHRALLTSFKWLEWEKSMEDARETSRADTILVAFASDWSPISGPMYRRVLQHPSVIDFLSRHRVEGFIIDCSGPDSPGWGAGSKYGNQAVPPSVAVWRKGHEAVFATPGQSPADFIASISGHLQAK